MVNVTGDPQSHEGGGAICERDQHRARHRSRARCTVWQGI